MIHDIILALNGIGGEALKKFINDGVGPDLLPIHICEKTILKLLMNTAESYKSLITFAKKVHHFGEEKIVLDDGSELQPGMYLRAFCNGLHNSLDPYLRCLGKLEEELLKNPNFTLSKILASVTEFSPLLKTLNAIVYKIVYRKLHGCKILSLIHDELSTGIDVVDEALAKLKQSCHEVMMKQLSGWLLYGQLVDPYCEFFIEADMSSRDNQQSSMTTLDTDSLPDTVMLDTSLPEYKIVHDQVPRYLPPSLAEKVKTIGSTVVLFSRDPKEKKPDVKMKMYDSVYGEKEMALTVQLKLLQNSIVLDNHYFESVMDNFKSCVTQRLFTVAKEQAGLMQELQLVKEFYLLGRGELFVAFLRKASSTLTRPVSTNSGRDLSNLLYSAVGNVYLNNDLIMERFSFKVPPKETVSPRVNVWSVLTLEYTPPWPLHLLFTPAVISSYNTLFHFMLQVKMVELNLHDVWIENVKRKDKPVPAEVWTLRNSLMFLVHGLQSYLMSDVLESESDALQAALANTHDFEQIVLLHTVFLQHVSAQAFLLSKEVQQPDQPPEVKRHPVNKCLISILKLCDNFCSEVSSSEISTSILKALSDQLDCQVGMLMNLISLLGFKARGLRLLLLRLDYNRYFSLKHSS